MPTNTLVLFHSKQLLMGEKRFKNGLGTWKFSFLSVVNAEGSKMWVLLTTMCAGDGDLASLSACLL